MATNRTSEHLRYRYGICLNDNCQKSKNKEVQQIAARKDFVCEECGKPLRECPPPKSGPNKMIIAIFSAIVVIIACIIIFLRFSGSCTTKSNPIDSINLQRDTPPQPLRSDTVTIVKTDTVVKTDIVVVKEKEQVPVKTKTPKAETAKSNGKVILSYGSYSGDWNNGYPDGMGRLTYSTSRVINKYDSKKRTANAGDYVIGEFVNGFFIQGKHYSSDGTLIETLMVGAPPSNTYENK